MDILKETGDRIRFYRKKKHMTVEQLAAAICKTKSCVSKYENGQIAVDILSLYDIANALNIRVSQLLFLAPGRTEEIDSSKIPAFFAGLHQFYVYLYDGRTNCIMRSLIDVLEPLGEGKFRVQMFMNVKEFQHYQLCETVYDGVINHFDTISTLILQNQDMEMDHYQIAVPSPYMNAPTKWGLAFGISSRPLMPTSAKVLLAKAPQPENAELEKDLRLSKEDYRLMRMYNMLTIL